MKTKTTNLFVITLVLASLIFVSACKEDIPSEPSNKQSTVTLDSVIDRRGSRNPDSTLTFYGNVTDKGSSNVTERGFCWNNSIHPTNPVLYNDFTWVTFGPCDIIISILKDRCTP